MSWHSGSPWIWSIEGVGFHPSNIPLLPENDCEALWTAQAPTLEMSKRRLRSPPRWCLRLLPGTRKPRTMSRPPGDAPGTYLQFRRDPRVALFSFGAVLPSLSSRPQVSFVSFLTFGPFMASGSVIAIVSMVSLNNQTCQSLTRTICSHTNTAPKCANSAVKGVMKPSQTQP